MNEKLNIQNLIDLLVQKQGLNPKDAEKFVKTFFSLITEGLEQDRYVKIRKLGTFKLIDVDSRESVNVNNGERIEIQGHTKISFTPDTSLKELINRPFAHFETVILNENTVLDDILFENNDEEENENIPDDVIPVTSITDEQIATDTTKEKKSSENERKEEKIITDETETGNISDEDKLLTDDVAKNEISFPVPKNNDMKYFITLVILVVFVCAGAVFFIYNPDFFVRPVPPPEEPQHIVNTLQEKQIIDSTSLVMSKIDSEQVDSIYKDSIQKIELTRTEKNVTQPVTEVAEERFKVPPAPQPFAEDTSNYEIVGTETTHTLAEGETLTRVALKYYGTKVLWPYLVKHNPDVIKNPNNVPCGTIIKIPKLEKK